MYNSHALADLSLCTKEMGAVLSHAIMYYVVGS
jgi:hypothetical protein